VRPSLALEWTFNIYAFDNNPLRDGRIDRRKGWLIRQQLLTVSKRVKNITILLPDGDVEEVAIIDYSESWGARPKRSDLGWTIQMTFIQVRTISDNPINEGITYDSLEAYTLDELEAII
jgi:hypothetical protein